ncbi:MAG: hypothetical protein EZS28_020863 [Streblomastix strix]|uniref:Uncharacterized protein n=1 Tax=Streblomastix strix TaxID=222440 RepID=A0A5J4VM85_9EUKA|nr:MAG: hypothetical protein EZS28_020863 [Streblomastix strix]
MGYSIQRLLQIHRIGSERTEGGTQQLHTQIIKVKRYEATLTFRFLTDFNVTEKIQDDDLDEKMEQN